MDKRCGTCRWWMPMSEHEITMRTDYAIGTCEYPLPFWVGRLQPFAKAGVDCPCYEPKEARCDHPIQN